MEMAEHGRRYCALYEGEQQRVYGKEWPSKCRVNVNERGKRQERGRKTTYMKSACRGSTRKTRTAPGTTMSFFVRRLLARSAVVVFVAFILEENAVVEGNRINALRRITGLHSIRQAAHKRCS